MKARQILMVGVLGLAGTIGAGCSSSMTYEHMASENGDVRLGVKYDRTPTLTQSLFPGDSAVIGNKEVATILDSKVRFPEDARIAVLALDDNIRWNWHSRRLAEQQQAATDAFFAAILSNEKVDSVAYLPSMLMPNTKTIPYLRAAAARFQADMLLVYSSASFTWQRDKFLAPDEIRANCFIEAVLIDTRTGVVPFSTSRIATASGEKTKDDYDEHEAQLRIQIEAQHKALEMVGEKIRKYLED